MYHYFPEDPTYVFLFMEMLSLDYLNLIKIIVVVFDEIDFSFLEPIFGTWIFIVSHNRSIARQRPQHTHGQQYRSSVFFVSVQLAHA
jgi:TRAP-type mannitol/chloroaromatic compound transport system permease large subunit